MNKLNHLKRFNESDENSNGSDVSEGWKSLIGSVGDKRRESLLKQNPSELNILLDRFKKTKEELDMINKEYDNLFGNFDNEELEILGQELVGFKSEFQELLKKFEYGVESGEFNQILNYLLPKIPR